MDKAQYEQAIAIISKARLDKDLKEMLSVAEDAWKSQLQAVKAIDHRNDEVLGEELLIDLDIALKHWIIQLEIIANAAQKVAKRANKALHQSGSYPEAEIDSEGYSPYGESDQANAQRTSSGTDDRRRSRRYSERHRIIGNGNKSRRKAVYKNFNKNTPRRKQVSGGGI